MAPLGSNADPEIIPYQPHRMSDGENLKRTGP